MKEKSNVCGIIAVCTGWLIPLAGITLGIIALARKERDVAWGIIGIVESVFFWFIWMAILL